jgi:hypothetical protein
MRTKSIWLLAAATAIALGIVSPYFSGLAVDRQLHNVPVVFEWFYWLPTLVDFWLAPESDLAFMTLWRVVLTLQYLAVFAMIWASTHLTIVLQHFVKPHRHRGGLVSRRA